MDSNYHFNYRRAHGDFLIVWSRCYEQIQRVHVGYVPKAKQSFVL